LVPRHAARAALIVLGAPGFVLAAPRICAAADRRLDLHVTRTAGAEDCPDTNAVGVAVAGALGRDVHGPEPGGAADLHVEVSFARRGSRYVATMKATSAHVTDERTIAHESSTCATLADAVVAAVGERLDEGDELDAPMPAPADAAPGSTAAPPLPAPTPSARPTPAKADPDDVPPHDATGSRRDVPTLPRWYGWQILTADAVAFTVAIAGAATNGSGSDDVAVTGLASFVLGGPIIHAAHGRGRIALASAGLRVALPVLGAVIGASAAPHCPSPGAPTSGDQTIGFCVDPAAIDAIYGMLIGMVVATSIDAAALSWDRVPAPPDTASTRPTLHLAPVAFVRPQPGGGAEGMLGVVGSM
jgi:hypothetical protein